MLMGHDVICVDNYFTGSKANIVHWIGHPNFEMIRYAGYYITILLRHHARILLAFVLKLLSNERMDRFLQGRMFL